jgi:Ni/Fe-hydrogenase subunit HybB-like protein
VARETAFITRGVRRCSTPRFLLWLTPWAALLLFGMYCAGLCLVKGLNQTNMDNRFAFGLWIFVDLTIIALGAGAFFTGFLLYILKFKELKAVINSAVVIGVVCYSGAMCALMVDVGQPCAPGLPSGTRTCTPCSPRSPSASVAISPCC